MPTYAMLSTLGPDGWATLREKPDRLTEVNTEVEALGLKVVAQYALLGEFDFLNILESPDEQTMARAAVMLAARGTLKTRTLQAIPIQEFIDSLKKDAE
ncbi:MAG: GYD domain-containing protein [Actinobacteria bacterium]|nr:GYD domain-containing protein [Actinomycetota bacterium]